MKAKKRTIKFMKYKRKQTLSYRNKTSIKIRKRIMICRRTDKDIDRAKESMQKRNIERRITIDKIITSGS